MPNYLATLDGKTVSLSLQDNPAGGVLVTIGETTYALDTAGATVLIDGKPARALVSSQGSRVEVELDGRRFEIDLEDARLAKHGAKKAGGSGKAAVRSPMPGRVARLLVKEGDTVKEKQGLLVIEAMKMENELKSPIAGVVTKLIPAARVGQNVDGGEEVAVIERAPAS